MGSIKDRNGMDLTEAEDIKKRWQEYTEELYKKDLHDPAIWATRDLNKDGDNITGALEHWNIPLCSVHTTFKKKKGNMSLKF